jgi:PhzF family phenazine biosynthesis protein
MKIPKIIYHVDAFTNEAFKGNPAGVCIIGNEPSETWMQNIAMELNLSETAFVFSNKKERFIRFYTPEAEVPLCGHATLSASHIMYETSILKADEEVILLSGAGELKVRRKGTWITMNFPSYSLDQLPVPAAIENIIGIKPTEFYKSSFGWTLVLADNEKMVRDMKPDFRMMKNSEYGDLIVTAKSEEAGFDFCVRCFAPALGIDEDPVTGSAHCALVPFWHNKTGKNDFTSHQVSKRSGVLKVSLKGGRVEISGQAKTVLKAELFV